MVDEPNELNTSDGSTQDELALETEQEAPASSAEAETEEDLLSVVQSAIDENETEETDSQSVEEIEDYDDDDLEEESSLETASDEADEEENSDKGPVPYKRFQQVNQEKNEYKEGHRQYQQITTYLASNNINAEEASMGLQIMALMKNDPSKALEALQPYMQALQNVTGETMPDDIRSKVDDGYMDEDTGRELSRARAEAAALRQQNERAVAQSQQVQNQQVLNHLANTVTEWENKTRQTDPDYDLKQDEIDDRVRVLVSEKGRPTTEADAIALAEQAHAEVTQRHKGRQITRKPMRTSSGGKLGGTPTPEPNSLLEAVQNAMANGSA